MRFAITGSDRYLGVFEAFLKSGWKPIKLFIVPVVGPLDSNQAIVSRATQLELEVQGSRMSENDLADLANRGCEALVVAGYDWRIGDWRPSLSYAVNFHCSPLPIGRGPYPIVRAILENRPGWGVTCHKLEHEFDAGDILAQELFPMSAGECHDSLEIKIQLAAIRLAARVAESFPKLWAEALPQGEGSYWKKWTREEQTIDFAWPVDSILRHTRAFGPIGSIATINGASLSVRRAIGWEETHRHPIGAVVHVAQTGHQLVVAASNGYVGLTEWSLIR
jgi:methionyl-tRNA formyltransferase